MTRFLVILLCVVFALTPAVTASKSLFIIIPHTEGEKEYTWFVLGLERFKAKHPDVDVRFEHMSGPDLPTKLTTYLVAGEIPDVVYMMQRDLGSIVSSDNLIDLNQFMRTDPEMQSRFFVPSFLQYWSRDGKQLAIPINPDTGYIYYNIDMFENAGLPALPQAFPSGHWTWDDFRRYAQRLTLDTNGDGATDVWGYQGSLGWEPVWGSWVYSNGGFVYDRATKQCGLDQPEAYEALQWLYDLKTDGYMAPGGPLSNGFHQRAMSSNAAGWAQYAKDSGFRIGSFLHPAPAGKKVTHVVLGPGMLVFKETKHPDLAWELIKEITSDESMVLLAELTGRLPSRLSAIRSWQRLYAEKMEGPEWVVAAVESGRGMPYNSKWADMNAIISRGLSEMWSGSRPAQAVFADVAARIEALAADAN
jgi:multiple sugar transport system substrate-binding protein